MYKGSLIHICIASGSKFLKILYANRVQHIFAVSVIDKDNKNLFKRQDKDKILLRYKPVNNLANLLFRDGC